MDVGAQFHVIETCIQGMCGLATRDAVSNWRYSNNLWHFACHLRLAPMNSFMHIMHAL